jgi:hypothetical protein
LFERQIVNEATDTGIPTEQNFLFVGRIQSVSVSSVQHGSDVLLIGDVPLDNFERGAAKLA